MRKFYWYLTTYLKKHGWVVLGSVVIAVVLFSIFIPTIVRSLETKPRRYIGVVGSFNLNNLPPIVLDAISSGLTRIESDGSVVPNIAERWTIEDDGRTYRFVIKDNLIWQDGKKVIPSDITYSLSNVETITTSNDIIYKLPDTFVPFPSIVSQPAIRIVQERYMVFFSRPVPLGIGSYRVVDYKQKNNRLSEITLDGPRERRIYRFYFTEDDAILAFKHGNVDILPDLSSPHSLNTWPSVEVSKDIKTNRYLAVFFNNSKPIFQKNIRQALNYSLVKPTDETRAISPISPESWAYLEGGKSYDYDIERAKERLLDEPPQQPLLFELTTTANFQEEGQKIKEAWENFGLQVAEACRTNSKIEDKVLCENSKVKVNLRVTNFPDTSEFDALLVGQEIPPDPDQYGLWHSGQSTNFTNFKNTRIDALLEKGRTTMDQSERKAIYQEFQQFFLEDSPVIFLRYLDSYEAKRK